MSERFLRRVVGLFVGIWVARYLGPRQFGLLNYAQSYVGLFTAFATLGLDSIVIRELVRDENKRDVLLGTAFLLKLIGAAGVFLILTGAMQFSSNDRETNLLVFIIAGAVIFQSFNVIDFYFQAKVLSRYVVYANFMAMSLTSVIKIILIVVEAPLIAFAVVITVDSFILVLGYLYFWYYNGFSIHDWIFNKRIAKRLLKDCWPLMFSGTILMIQSRIDQVMLKEYIGNIAVGYYSVALKLVETFGFVPMILQSSLAPSLVKKDMDPAMQEQRFLNYYRLNFFMFLIVGTPIFIFSEYLVTLLFGSAYRPAGTLLSLMAFRLFFTNMGVARSVFIIRENLFRFSLLTMTVGTLANILMNAYWIPIYGAPGAVVATIVSSFVTVFLLDAFYPRTRSNLIWMLKGITTFYKLRPEVG